MNGEVITIYLPIFEEKLAKLDARGLGGTEEAARLRKALRWAESARTRGRTDETRAAA